MTTARCPTLRTPLLQRRLRRGESGDGDPKGRAAYVIEFYIVEKRDYEICRGCLIADIPAIVGSLDIVMGEIDR